MNLVMEITISENTEWYLEPYQISPMEVFLQKLWRLLAKIV